MCITEREKNIYGQDVEIVLRGDERIVYRIEDETGHIVMTSYKVFPGIELIYNDVHLQRCSINKSVLGDIIQINHCREGRIECEFKDEFFYLSSGDLSISMKNDAGHDSYFPLSHYHGITIMIDVNRAPRCLSCFLDDVNVQPSVLVKKFCSNNKGFVSRAEKSVEHIFSELYSVPESIKKGYFKVKILELLLFLNGMDIKCEQVEKRYMPKTQVILAKSVCKYLTEHMDCRITLEQLSELFSVSGTQLKNSFKGVYGVPIYSYIRTQKMQAAALMIGQTDRTILDIAEKYGYDNGSKFAKAFKEVIGMNPNEYRRKK